MPPVTTALSTAQPASLMPQPEAIAAESRQVLNKHARTFRWAAAFLSRACHDDAAIAYAFCRHIDDTADEAASIEQAQRGLAQVDDELAGRCRPSPLTAAYCELEQRRHIAKEAAQQLIEGARSDLLPVAVPDDGSLLRYCYRVAGTVGLMMCGVLGVRSPRAIAHAVDLGVGMQITNICRDVLEDARRGRVYLPATRLLEVGVTPQELVAGTADRKAVARVVEQLLALAERYYSSADAGMHYIPLRARLAIVAASRIYRAIGRRLLRRHHGDALHGRTIVPWSEKVFWLLMAFGAWVTITLGLRKRPHDPQLHIELTGLLPTATSVADGDDR